MITIDPIIEKSIDSEKKYAEEVIAKFQSRAAEFGNVTYACLMIEEVYKAWHVLNEIEQIMGFVQRENGVECFLEEMDDRIKRTIRNLLEDDDWRHNSTSYVANIENMAKVRAKQKMLPFWQNVVESVRTQYLQSIDPTAIRAKAKSLAATK